MDFGTMQTRVRDVIRDSNAAFISDSEIQGWLNEANEDVARRLRILRQIASGTWTSGVTLTLPADFMEALTLEVNSKKVEFVPDSIMDARIAIGGTPVYISARVFGNVIEIFPTQAAVPYTLRYLKRPTTMTAPADVSELPTFLHARLVQYGRAHAQYAMGELEAGDRYLAMYESSLPPELSSKITRTPHQALPTGDTGK